MWLVQINIMQVVYIIPGYLENTRIKSLFKKLQSEKLLQGSNPAHYKTFDPIL